MSIKKIRIAEGVYKRTDTKGILTYYISYTQHAKLTWETVGRKNDGITLQYCKQLRSKRVNEIRLGEDVSSQRRKEITLFDDIAQEHIDTAKMTYKNSYGPVQRYEQHIQPHIGHMNILDISKSDIEYIMKTMISKGLKPATVDRVRQTISAIFNLAIFHEKCKENPAALLKNDNVSVMRRNRKNISNNRERYLTREEAILLLKELRYRSEKVYLITLIALTTGARAGEILGIKYKDIDYDSGFITLPNTKNGESRKIKITSTVDELLQSMEQGKPNELLFQTTTNKRLDKIPKSYTIVANKLFNKDLDTDDAKNRVVFHTLRHTFASWLAIDGVPIFTIQKLMGHKDINMTLRYAKLSPDAGVDAVMNIERSLIG